MDVLLVLLVIVGVRKLRSPAPAPTIERDEVGALARVGVGGV